MKMKRIDLVDFCWEHRQKIWVKLEREIDNRMVDRWWNISQLNDEEICILLDFYWEQGNYPPVTDHTPEIADAITKQAADLIVEGDERPFLHIIRDLAAAGRTAARVIRGRGENPRVIIQDEDPNPVGQGWIAERELIAAERRRMRSTGLRADVVAHDFEEFQRAFNTGLSRYMRKQTVILFFTMLLMFLMFYLIGPVWVGISGPPLLL